MAEKTIILIEKNEETYAFTSLKKANEVFSWVKPESIHKLYPKKKEFTYKGAKFKRIPLN